DARPPVGKVIGLGDEAPDVLARREQLAGCGVRAHLDESLLFRRTVVTPAWPAAKRLRPPEMTRVATVPGSLPQPGPASAEADQLADAAAQEADQAPELRRGDDRDHDRAEAGQGEGDE